MRTDDTVVVVGAGVIGAAAARELAPTHDVTVLERDQVAGEASGKASGVVSLQVQYEYAPDAVSYGLEFVEGYDGHNDVEYTRRPSVELARPEHVADAKAYAEFVAGQAFDATYLDADELGARFPDVFDLSGFAGGVVFERMGWLDPYTFTTALVRDATDAGAALRTGVAADAVLVEDGAVVGVETDSGVVEADAVVVAAGWRSEPLLADHLALPIYPERYKTVNLETDRDFDEDFPMGSASDPHHYWRPEHNGDLHVGGGADIVDPPGTVRTNADEAFLQEVAAAVPDRIVGLDDARIASDDVCPTGDALTPDRYPIVDAPTAAPDGLVVATGFSGYGVMAAPIAGAAVRHLVTGESLPFSLEHFRYDRFADPAADFEQPLGEPFTAHEPASLW